MGSVNSSGWLWLRDAGGAGAPVVRETGPPAPLLFRSGGAYPLIATSGR